MAKKKRNAKPQPVDSDENIKIQKSCGNGIILKDGIYYIQCGDKDVPLIGGYVKLTTSVS